jgi:hypothetical protein
MHSVDLNDFQRQYELFEGKPMNYFPSQVSHSLFLDYGPTEVLPLVDDTDPSIQNMTHQQHVNLKKIIHCRYILKLRAIALPSGISLLRFQSSFHSKPRMKWPK